VGTKSEFRQAGFRKLKGEKDGNKEREKNMGDKKEGPRSFH